MFFHNLVVRLKKHWFVGVRSIDVNCVCDIYLYNISYDCNKSIDVLTLCFTERFLRYLLINLT